MNRIQAIILALIVIAVILLAYFLLNDFVLSGGGVRVHVLQRNNSQQGNIQPGITVNPGNGTFTDSN